MLPLFCWNNFIAIQFAGLKKPIAWHQGQQLGAGCFGRVVKAEAVGIGGTETVTTVAVKMVKATAQSDDALAALIRELKILIYMGSHVNVVNLLGACTKTNVRGEIKK